MTHFAYVVDGVVARVHVLANEVITDSNGEEQEHLGQIFLANLHGYNPENLIQCSYNDNFRGSYPGVGYVWDEQTKVFSAPVFIDSVGVTNG